MEEIEEKQDRKKIILKILICTIIAIIVVFMIEKFFIQPVRTKNISMYPTIKEDEIILINKWFGVTNQVPQRGDIIMFELPSVEYIDENTYNSNNIIADYSESTSINFIKRVVGLPGEHVKITKDGEVYINDKLLKEDYVKYSKPKTSSHYDTQFQFCDVIVPEDCVYVLGDNPDKAADSRSFGCIPIERIEGKVWIRIYPFGDFGEINFKSYYWYFY